MAIMHPIDIDNYDCTKTERDFYLALKEQLPDDKYQVFYSVRWFETDENNKRVDSESDFLIFNPSYGFIAIEVKGGTNIRIDDGKWFLEENYRGETGSERALKCSPYEQAEKSMRHFHDYFEKEFNKAFNGIYGFAVAFPAYSIDKNGQVAQNAPIEATIDLNDMENLLSKIKSIFHYWKNKRNITIHFSAQQSKKFVDCVNKQISISAAAGALIPIKEKEFAKIDYIQDSFLDLLYNYNQVQIIGGAGTGKTFIGIKKAIREAQLGKKVLFICCNNELSKFVSKKVSDYENIYACIYESLMVELLGDEYFSTPVNENGNHECYDLIDNISFEDKYDSIIVDEAQDFDIDMGFAINGLLRNPTESTLYVFYDKNQNVFSRNFSDAFEMKNLPFILRYNIRNTGAIYTCAVERTALGNDTIANNLVGVAPEIKNYKNKSQTLNALSQIVNRLVQKEYVETKSIVVITDKGFENSILANETQIGAYNITHKNLEDVLNDEICVKTAEDFKGLEANIVIYVTHNDNDTSNDTVKRSKEYVALTRARYYLYILNSKS